MSGRRNGLVLAIVLVISSLGIIRAQDPPPTGMVYVSVKVTDDNGRYVTGLRKEDFGLAEEGIEQMVTFLEEEKDIQNREYEYRIGYVPKNAAKDGGWRRIRVRVVSTSFPKRLSVVATMGYYAR
jgi:hypothetical protein